MAKTRKRGLALLMAVVLALSLLPVSALASGEEETTHEALTLAVGDKETLVPYADEASGRWYVEPEKEDVVSVDEYGVIHAMGEGTANVYFEYTVDVPETLEEVPAVVIPETPAVEEPTVEEPAVEEPAVEEPAVEEPTVEEPTVEEPAVEEPTVEEPTVNEIMPLTSTQYSAGAETKVEVFPIEVVADPEVYTVEFIWNTNAGILPGAKNANEVYAVVEVAAGESIGDQMPVDPVYYSLFFKGWNTQADGKGHSIDADSTITGDLKVYGQWTVGGSPIFVTEYHVMELDTKVDAYIRAALALDADDAYSITEMRVADDTICTDSDDHWAENNGQTYWYILNAGSIWVWEDSGLVWPELLDHVEIDVKVEGAKKRVNISREDFDLVRLSRGEAKGHIVEIYLREDSIPQPPVEEETGTLMVGKSVAGLSSYVGVPADYSVTITVTAAGETEPICTLDSSNADPGVDGRVLQWEVKEVPTGTYTVTETYSPDIVDKDGNVYKADASKAQITNNGVITVEEDAVVWANVTNTYEKSDETTEPPVEKKTGTLMVGKSVAGLSSYVGVPEDYSVTITVTAEGEKYPTYTLTRFGSHPGVDGRVLQWELRELPVGTYIVKEVYSPDIIDKDGNVYKADASKAQITNNGVITVEEDAVVWANVTNTYEKSGEETNPPVTPASLTLTKSVDKTYANPGDEVTYTIYVRNSGTTAAQDVTVTDTLDSYLTFVSGSEGVSAQGQEVSWTGDVAGESVVSFQVTARISEDTPVNTFITNRAYVDTLSSNEVWTKVEEETEIPGDKVQLSFQYVTDVHGASVVPNGVTAPETVELEKGSVFGTYGHGTGDYGSRYTFHGWFADPACNVPMEEDTVLTQDTVVYGYWTHSSGGSGGSGDGDGGSTDVPDENVPTTDLPDVDVPTTDVPGGNTGDQGTDLGDGDVPLAEVPKTGDSSALWILAAAISGIGLVWLTICKKRETER